METSARRIIRLCSRHGLLDDTQADPLAAEEPVLAALTAASVRGLIATGARSGQRLRRALKDPAAGVRTAPLCFASRGFSLHAATRIARPDRSGLDPDLSGGGRAAGGASAEGPAAAAVRVRRLTSPPFAPCAESRREECVLNGLIEYRIGPARGPQTTKPYCEPCPTTCKRSSASLPCAPWVCSAP